MERLGATSDHRALHLCLSSQRSPYFLQLTALWPLVRNKPRESYRQKKKPLVAHAFRHVPSFAPGKAFFGPPMESPFCHLRKSQGIMLGPSSSQSGSLFCCLTLPPPSCLSPWTSKPPTACPGSTHS